MTISYIGQTTGVNSATLPTHQSGDLIIGFAYRDGSIVPPIIPSGVGWNTISTAGGGSTNGSALVYQVASSSGTTTGTFTNATSVVFLVYRGASPANPIGVSNSSTGTTASVTFPALALTDTGGTSWVVGFVGHRSVNTSLETPPTGMVNRAPVVDATDEAAGHDTNGTVSSWSSTSVAVGGTASGWMTRVVEIRDSLTHSGGSSLAGAGTLSSTATNAKEAASDLNAGGTLAVSANTSGYSGYYRRKTEAGDYRVTEDVVYRIDEQIHSGSLTGAADLSGSGTLAAAATTVKAGIASLTGSGSIASSGTITQQGASSLSGSGALTAAATIILNGVAALAGSGVISSSGTLTQQGAADLSGSGTLTSDADRNFSGSSSLSGSGQLTAVGQIVILAEAGLSAAGSLAAAGELTPNAVINLLGLGTLSSSAITFRVGKIYAKSGGQWHEVIPSVNYDGDWVVPSYVYVKTGGVWKRIFVNGN